MKPAGHVQIAPSLLSADFANLGDAVRLAERGGADMIHFDVMDGHFVPNITIGPPVLKSLARVSTLPIDVHLMIEHPDRYVAAFVEAGAASISVHAEAAVHLHRVVHLIKSLGVKAGVVLNPATPVTALEEIAGEFERLVSEEEGILTAELTTAVELSDEDERRLLEQIEKASGRKVEATRQVDPDLIGGIVLQVGSHRLDASVRGRLDQLRRALAGASS